MAEAGCEEFGGSKLSVACWRLIEVVCCMGLLHLVVAEADEGGPLFAQRDRRRVEDCHLRGPRRRLAIQQCRDLADRPQEPISKLQRPNAEALASRAVVLPNRLTTSVCRLGKLLRENVVTPGGNRREGRGKRELCLHTVPPTRFVPSRLFAGWYVER